MKDIMTAPFVREMCETTANMYRLGWDERNGGNISYLLKEEEVSEYLDLSKVERVIPLMGVASSASARAGRTSNSCGALRTAADPPPNSPRT